MSQVAFACLPLAVFLAFVPHYIRVVLIARKLREDHESLDGLQANPREAALAAASGGDARSRMISRAGNAHNNQLENLAIFIGAILAGAVVGVPRRAVDVVAAAYVVMRALYIWLYVTGEEGSWKGPVRTLLWNLCFLSCLYLYVHAATLAPTPA